MEFLEAQHISKSFINHKALDDVSISVPKGSIYGLLGPNGAGKTTLIRIINQITVADSGNILLDGKKMTTEDINRIGYLPEERGLYKKMKVGEQAVYLARLHGLSKTEAIERLKQWFIKFRIETWWDKKVEDLSKGMAQKVQFISTVLHDPDVMIFDEPFSGFDPINVELLKNEILEFREKGHTIIFSTHNMSSVEEICSHIALLNKSHKVVEGEINSIREAYANNTYELCCRYNPDFKAAEVLGNEFEILSEDVAGIHHTITLIQKESGLGNLLLQRLLPQVEVISFEKIIPSMNDIFINLVKSENNE